MRGQRADTAPIYHELPDHNDPAWLLGHRAIADLTEERERSAMRKHPAQINFRCQDQEKAAYDALAKELNTPLSKLVRDNLNGLVKEHLGQEWLEVDE